MNSNKYNSLSDTFYATDLYNLVMPAVPPALLSIASTVFAESFFFGRYGATTKVVGFDKRDNPYIRSLGLFSNLGAGLVDAAANHVGGGTNWMLQLQLERYAARLTGVISNNAGSAALTGAGTLFTTELGVGSVLVWLDNNKVVRRATVMTITDDTNIVLTGLTDNAGMRTGNTGGKIAYPWISNAGNTADYPFVKMNTLFDQAFYAGNVTAIYPPRGTVTVTTSIANIEGVGTYFTQDYHVGQPIVFGAGADRRVYIIATIVSDTLATLTQLPSLGIRGAALVDYDDHIRLCCRVVNAFSAYTVDLNPLYGADNRRLSIGSVADIEHTFPLILAVT